MVNTIIIIIESIDEIIDTHVKYAHSSRPERWIRVDMDVDGEFDVYGMVSGDFSTSVTSGGWNSVKSWKTFNGVKRSLKLFSKKNSWGMGHWIK